MQRKLTGKLYEASFYGAMGFTWNFTIKAKHISIEILIIVNINNLFIHTSTIFINTYFNLSIQLTG